MPIARSPCPLLQAPGCCGEVSGASLLQRAPPGSGCPLCPRQHKKPSQNNQADPHRLPFSMHQQVPGPPSSPQITAKHCRSTKMTRMQNGLVQETLLAVCGQSQVEAGHPTAGMLPTSLPKCDHLHLTARPWSLCLGPRNLLYEYEENWIFPEKHLFAHTRAWDSLQPMTFTEAMCLYLHLASP